MKSLEGGRQKYLLGKGGWKIHRKCGLNPKNPAKGFVYSIKRTFDTIHQTRDLFKERVHEETTFMVGAAQSMS